MRSLKLALIAISLLQLTTAQGKIRRSSSNVWGSTGQDRGGSEEASLPTHSSAARDAYVSPEKSKCQEDKDYVSLEFLSLISDPNSISSSEINSGTGVVRIGRYMSGGCLKLEVKQGDIKIAGNEVYLKVQMTNIPNAAAIGLTGEEATKYDAMSSEEKVELCLKKKNLLSDEGYPVQENLTSDKLDDLEAHVGVNGSFDRNKNIEVYFGSNIKSSYWSHYKEGKPTNSPKEWAACTDYDLMRGYSGGHFAGVKPLYYSPIEKKIKEAIAACESKNAMEILNEIIRMKKDVGNAGVIVSTLEEILIQELIDEQEKIMEGNSEYTGLKKLESQMRDIVKKGDKSEFDAEETADEYAKLLKKLDKLVYEPAEKLMDKLHEDLKDGNLSKDEKKAINNKINKIAELFAQLSRKNSWIGKSYPDGVCNSVPCTFFRKQYIYEGNNEAGDYAKEFEEMRLKSLAHSNRYAGSRLPRNVKKQRGAPFDKKKEVTDFLKKIEKFEDKLLADWDEKAMAADGDKDVLRKKSREIAAYRRKQQMFVQNRYNGLGYCKYVSSPSCNKKKAQRDYLVQRSVYRQNQRMNVMMNDYRELDMLYGNYVRTQQQEGDFDPWANDFEYGSEFSMESQGGDSDWMYQYQMGHQMTPGGSPYGPPRGPASYGQQGAGPQYGPTPYGPQGGGQIYGPSGGYQGNMYFNQPNPYGGYPPR